jgi:hypothetical protein
MTNKGTLLQEVLVFTFEINYKAINNVIIKT